ncbi:MULTISPECIES: hypothetical protein [Halobacterium]|uniref:hypothetical protein n=1 Tax=Halobacterium TaxID=2239 RepID=UPI0012F955FD|nr:MULTISPECIES: hypothetical protein [Halobacterium]MCG1002886.1 hypothetical protein [Halobacterium noricense]
MPYVFGGFVGWLVAFALRIAVGVYYSDTLATHLFVALVSITIVAMLLAFVVREPLGEQ